MAAPPPVTASAGAEAATGAAAWTGASAAIGWCSAVARSHGAGAAGVSGSDVEKSTSWGSGIEQQNIGVVVYLFSGWMVALQQRATIDLVVGGRRMGRTPPTAYAEASLQAFMRGDAKTRAAFYQRGIADGWLSRNEVRDLENLEPQEGLDEFLVPSNLTLISVDGELVPLSSKGVEDAAESA